MDRIFGLISQGITAGTQTYQHQLTQEATVDRAQALASQSAQVAANRRTELMILGGVAVALAYAFARR